MLAVLRVDVLRQLAADLGGERLVLGARLDDPLALAALRG